MHSFSKIALGVAAALAAGTAFAAIDQNTAFDVKLNVAGSSAFRDPFKTEMASTLCADTPVVFQAAASGGVDLKAYGCTLKPSITDTTGAVWTFANNPNTGLAPTVLVYYRSEGGSVYGVGPVAKPSIQQNRLKVDSTCTGSASPFICAVSALNLTTDVATGSGAEKATVQLGVSDLEPAMFTGENWPTGGFLGNAPTSTELSNITSQTAAIGQVFAVYVSSNVPGASSGGSLNLTKEALSGIFSGALTNWSQVPKADGTGYISSSSLPIKVCLRDVGSGTQTGASLFFNGKTCSKSSRNFATTGGLTRNASTGSEISCIAGATATDGRIGYAALQQATLPNVAPANTALVSIDGVKPDPIAAASGQYHYWYEATFNSGAALNVDEIPTSTYPLQSNTNGTDASNAAAVTAIMIDDLTKASVSLPIGNGSGQTMSVISLKNANNPIVVPVDTTHPIATGTHFGNSCFQPTGTK